LIQKLKTGLSQSTLARTVRLLSSSDQKKLLIVLFLQMLSAFLDLVGMALVGVLGALAVSGFGAGARGDRVGAVLNFLHIQNFSLQSQSAILALFVAGLLVLRTLATVVISRKTLFFLGRKAATLSSSLVSRLLSLSLLKIKENSSQATSFSVTYGVSIIILGVLGTGITTAADIFLLFVLSVGLFILDPITAVVTLSLFGVVGIFMYKVTSNRARILGSKNTRLMIKSDEKIAEVFSSYRELVVRNRREFYVREISKIRLELAETSAEMQFMPHVSKYVIELTMVVGALVVGAVQFSLNDASRAVATLGVFLVAGTRIAPAVMRIQQGATGIKANLGVANPTLALIDSLKHVSTSEKVSDILDLEHAGFRPEIQLLKMSFSYPNSKTKTLSEISLSIHPGQRVAIVGSSGAGKTTLADILLGILSPDLGTTTISGLSPNEAIRKWPGSIGYVPQDVVLSHGTIRENIALGYPSALISDEVIWEALEKARIAEFIRSLPEGLDSPVGERGSKLSGGQKQRLGIARALVTNPKLLILDEATSSLDGKTEAELTQTFLDFDLGLTTIVIAHRLSTIKEADKIVYLKDGHVISTGTFSELRSYVPDFDEQATLMGL
jgi:ABC-type multidrug transport system fused ATPase/permease subunit